LQQDSPRGKVSDVLEALSARVEIQFEPESVMLMVTVPPFAVCYIPPISMAVMVL